MSICNLPISHFSESHTTCSFVHYTLAKFKNYKTYIPRQRKDLNTNSALRFMERASSVGAATTPKS